MTFTEFAICGYYDSKQAPQVAGEVVALDYWHEGLSYWVTLAETPPQLPARTALHLVAWWVNLSSVPICGHVGLVIIRPDRSEIAPAAVLNQDRWADPGNGWGVQFEPVTLDEAGSWQAIAELTTMGQPLDSKQAALAEVSPGAQFYMPSALDVRIEDGSILDMYWNCIFTLPISNYGEAPASRTIRVTGEYDGQAHRDYAEEISLNPGETYTWKLEQWVDFRRVSYYKVTVTGDWETNNYAEGVARP